MTISETIVIGGANIDIKARPHDVMKSATSNPGKITITDGGVARNIAHNLALLECPAALIARVGKDEQGHRLLRNAADAGVDVSLCIQVDEPTGIYCAVLDREGELAIGVNSMDITDGLLPGEVSPHGERLRRAGQIVVDCNVPQQTLEWLADFAVDSGRRLLIEAVSVPKTQKLLSLLQGGRHVFAATPNMYQAQAMTGLKITKASDAFQVAKAISKLGVELVVITLGEYGVYVHSPDESAHIPSFASDGATDVTGAGDAMTAGLVFGLAQGFSALDAAQLGQAAACITISSHASVSPDLSRHNLLALARQRVRGL
jgi:pseudouridine kinase